MALTPRRHLFGSQSGDWTGTIDGNGFLKSAPNATLWVWDVSIGGTRLTDLETAAGAAIDEIVTDANGTISEFYGPEDVQRVWVGDPSGGARTLLVATDWNEDIEGLDAAIDAVEVTAGVQTVNEIAPVSGDVTLGPADLEPTGALQGDVDTLEALIGTRLLQVSGAYPPRPTGANWVFFVGTIDPGGNAQSGDIWLQPAVA